MATVLALALTLVVVALHTLLTAVMARFFRIRLHTEWGWVLYTLVVIPFVLTATTLVSGIVIPQVFSSVAVLLAVMVGLPLSLGFTVELLYVPPPEEYELPDSTD
ncbi:hypothetical protein [Halorarum halobium]|uniref:hypothetical protein n=1 Tax=Halorarum halobium TaxID=3075121 RepID=UPI0028A73256|nr:hypothetical protein [Halobaculum sp. XH14]